MHANARELNAVSCSCYSRFRQPSLFKPSLKRQVRRNLTAGQDILWVDPGDVASLDFARDSLNKHRISSQQRERLLAMGFRDKNQKEITSDITVEDVRWLLQYLGRVTDEQITDGLIASGVSAENVDCFVRALRLRIGQLQRLAS
jgi:hypothetical protein